MIEQTKAKSNKTCTELGYKKKKSNPYACAHSTLDGVCHTDATLAAAHTLCASRGVSAVVRVRVRACAGGVAASWRAGGFVVHAGDARGRGLARARVCGSVAGWWRLAARVPMESERHHKPSACCLLDNLPPRQEYRHR